MQRQPVVTITTPAPILPLHTAPHVHGRGGGDLTDASSTSAPSSHQPSPPRPSRSSAIGDRDAVRPTTPEQDTMDIDSTSPATTSLSPSSASASVGTSVATTADDSLVLGRAKRISRKSLKAIEAEESGHSNASTRRRKSTRSDSVEVPFVVPVTSATLPRGVGRVKRVVSDDLSQPSEGGKSTIRGRKFVSVADAHHNPESPKRTTVDDALTATEEEEAERALTEGEAQGSSAASSSHKSPSVTSPRTSAIPLGQIITAIQLVDSTTPTGAGGPKPEIIAVEDSTDVDSDRATTPSKQRRRRHLPVQTSTRREPSKLVHDINPYDHAEALQEDRGVVSTPGELTSAAALPVRWRHAAAAVESSIATTRPRRSQGGERAQSRGQDSDAAEDETMTGIPTAIDPRAGSSQLVVATRDSSPADSTLSSVEYSGDEDEEMESAVSMVPDAETTKLKKARKPSRRNAQKKVYLSTGLYSPAFEVQTATDLLGQRSRRRGTMSAAPCIAASSGALKKTAFPQPIYYGHDLLVCPRDFSLPYPLVHEQEKTRARVDARRKPTRYGFIDRNRYVSRPKLKGELPLCQCRPGGNCGEDCLNRLLQFICDPKTCPCGDQCTNVSLGKRPHAECKTAWYGKRGFGLQTLQAIPKHGLVDEYRGEVIDLREAARRVNEHYKDSGNFYFLDYDAAAGEVLDGGLRGNITRFANHSCNPNCYIEKWLICGTDEPGTAEFQVGLFAARDIEPGEELTYDYGWSAFGTKQVAAEAAKKIPVACHCGAPNCSGVMGGKKPAGSGDASSSVTPVPGGAEENMIGVGKRKREEADAGKKARQQARKYAKARRIAKDKEGAEALSCATPRPIAGPSRLSARADTAPEQSTKSRESQGTEAESRRSTRERNPRKVDPVILTSPVSTDQKARTILKSAPRRLPLPGSSEARGGRNVAKRQIVNTRKKRAREDKKTRKRTASPKPITLPSALTPADAERMMASALQGCLADQQADISQGSWLDVSEEEEEREGEQENDDDAEEEEGQISEEESLDDSDEDYQEAEDEVVEDAEDEIIETARKRPAKGRLSGRDRARSGSSGNDAAGLARRRASTTAASYPPNTPLFFGDGQPVPTEEVDEANWHRRVYSAEDLEQKKKDQRKRNAESARIRRQARRDLRLAEAASTAVGGTGSIKVKSAHRKALAEMMDNGGTQGHSDQGTSEQRTHRNRRLPLPTSTQRAQKVRLRVNGQGRPLKLNGSATTTTTTTTTTTMSWSASSARSAVYNPRRRSTKESIGLTRNNGESVDLEIDPRYINKNGRPKSGINSKNGIKQYVIKGDNFESHPGVLPAIAAAAAAAKQALLASDGRLLRAVSESSPSTPPPSAKPAVSVASEDGRTPAPEGSSNKKKMVYASTIGLPAGITDPSGAYIPDLPSNLVDSGVMSKGDARRARNAFLARVRRFIKRGYSYEVALQKASFMRSKGDENTPLFRAKLAAEAGSETTPSPARSSATKIRAKGKGRAVEA